LHNRWARDSSPGANRHIVTDRQCIPLTFLSTRGNVRDSVPFEELIGAIPAVAGSPAAPGG